MELLIVPLLELILVVAVPASALLLQSAFLLLSVLADSTALVAEILIAGSIRNQ